jgi:hypothetical protein
LQGQLKDLHLLIILDLLPHIIICRRMSKIFKKMIESLG